MIFFCSNWAKMVKVKVQNALNLISGGSTNIFGGWGPTCGSVVEHRAVTQEVVTLTPAGPSLRVLK